MFSIIESRQTYGGQYIEGVCLTSDDKPVEGIANGSRLKEVNAATGELKNFQFDADTAEWIEITSEPGSGGGSGGSGAGEFLAIELVDNTLVCNWDVIAAASFVAVTRVSEVSGAILHGFVAVTGANDATGQYGVVVELANDAGSMERYTFVTDNPQSYPARVVIPGGSGSGEEANHDGPTE